MVYISNGKSYTNSVYMVDHKLLATQPQQLTLVDTTCCWVCVLPGLSRLLCLQVLWCRSAAHGVSAS
jgi:hypothetical protein